ncbi:hypothetical protein [Sphingomonas sp. 3P27F8]|uniref:hypothetical protein n=1 Tax=Sphingomonas sp. 3P27F8 TaxID=2502213 RepID=UPI0010F99894|nr:hypothetical protein [Sphingomonas sp. 3P27F8]
MARALKVFCTPIGFHDAYVAAPSQKAALEAWGTDANLFARGMAEVVTDPKLTKEPLASPGQVIKRARGTAAQHLAALPKNSKLTTTRAPSDAMSEVKPVKQRPRPSRRELDAAEHALERADDIYNRANETIRDREEALRRERHELAVERETEIAKLQRKLDQIREDYDRALSEWRGD